MLQAVAEDPAPKKELAMQSSARALSDRLEFSDRLQSLGSRRHALYVLDAGG
jgi:hypothetical protein